MDPKRRQTFGPVSVELAFHDTTVAVVCQEGCYPDKKAHINQDCFACEPRFANRSESNPNAQPQMLLGVFDGHGPNGEHCASIAANAFPALLRKLRSDATLASHGARDAKIPHREWDADEAFQSYSRAFVESDSTIMRALGDGAKSSGTTALVAHIIGDMLHMGNVGDSRGLLGVESGRTESAPSSPTRDGGGSPFKSGRRRSLDQFNERGDLGPRWDVLEVSHDQTCFRNDERERMRKEATEPVMFATLGMILGETPMSEDFGEESIEAADDPPRVFRKNATFPGCAFTRSLGDATGKTLGVCARPELLTYQLDTSTRCLILASDGVFEFMTNEEVLAIARRRKNDGPLAACQEIVATAYQHWAEEDTRSDDITCALIYFEPKPGAVEGKKVPSPSKPSLPRVLKTYAKNTEKGEFYAESSRKSFEDDSDGLPSSSRGAENWKKIRDVLRAGAIRNRPAARFANTVLAAAAVNLRRRRGSLAMEELFPGFDFHSVGEVRRMGSLRGGLKAPERVDQKALARLSIAENE